jgi:hypothetical protein
VTGWRWLAAPPERCPPCPTGEACTTAGGTAPHCAMK